MRAWGQYRNFGRWVLASALVAIEACDEPAPEQTDTDSSVTVPATYALPDCDGVCFTLVPPGAVEDPPPVYACNRDGVDAGHCPDGFSCVVEDDFPGKHGPMSRPVCVRSGPVGELVLDAKPREEEAVDVEIDLTLGREAWPGVARGDDAGSMVLTRRDGGQATWPMPISADGVIRGSLPVGIWDVEFSPPPPSVYYDYPFLETRRGVLQVTRAGAVTVDLQASAVTVVVTTDGGPLDAAPFHDVGFAAYGPKGDSTIHDGRGILWWDSDVLVAVAADGGISESWTRPLGTVVGPGTSSVHVDLRTMTLDVSIDMSAFDPLAGKNDFELVGFGDDGSTFQAYATGEEDGYVRFEGTVPADTYQLLLVSGGRFGTPAGYGTLTTSYSGGAVTLRPKVRQVSGVLTVGGRPLSTDTVVTSAFESVGVRFLGRGESPHATLLSDSVVLLTGEALGEFRGVVYDLPADVYGFASFGAPLGSNLSPGDGMQLDWPIGTMTIEPNPYLPPSAGPVSFEVTRITDGATTTLPTWPQGGLDVVWSTATGAPAWPKPVESVDPAPMVGGAMGVPAGRYYVSSLQKNSIQVGLGFVNVAAGDSVHVLSPTTDVPIRLTWGGAPMVDADGDLIRGEIDVRTSIDGPDPLPLTGAATVTASVRSGVGEVLWRCTAPCVEGVPRATRTTLVSDIQVGAPIEVTSSTP